jgi:thioredoxin reductase
MDLDAERIFLAIGQYPADDLGAELGCKRDAGGHIVVDQHYHTSIPSVFAAGDIVPGAQLAIAAAADGAIAALAMHKSLKSVEQLIDCSMKGEGIRVES